jgi:hypothetical protein
MEKITAIKAQGHSSQGFTRLAPGGADGPQNF